MFFCEYCEILKNNIYFEKHLRANPVKYLWCSSFAKIVKPLSANQTKWSNTLKQFVGSFRRIFLYVFDHFLGLALQGLETDRLNPLLVTHLQITHCYHEINTGKRNMFRRYKENVLLEDYAKCFGKNYLVRQLSYAKNQNKNELMQWWRI